MATRQSTVAFFEIVLAKDARSPRMQQCDWRGFLDYLKDLPMEKRISDLDQGMLVGQAVETPDGPQLLVGRIGPRDLQTIDLDRGHIEDLRLEGNRGTVDTTTVCFLEYGNVIGTLQGGTGAPRASALQRWLNSCGPLNEEIALWPVISNNVWEKLEKAEAVHSFEFTFQPSPLTPPPEGAGLSTFYRQGREDYPDHKISVKIAIPKQGGPGPAGRLRGQRRLRNQIPELMNDIGYLEGPTGISRARANVTVMGDDGDLHDEPLDFLKHRITAKCKIPITHAGGRPSYLAKVEAVLGAAQDHGRDLRAAVSPEE